jgi:hypothetical protein
MGRFVTDPLARSYAYPKGLGAPLTFIQHRGVEFAGGLVEYKGDLLVSYGVPDRGAAFCILPYGKVSQWVASMGQPSEGIG